MAIPIPGTLINFILLGPMHNRRLLQDSPILGDVWVEFGKQPGERLDLLIEPLSGVHAGKVAGEIDDDLALEDNSANIAFLQGTIVACLTFEELMRVVAPKTKWWVNRQTKDVPQKEEEKQSNKEVAAAKTKKVIRDSEMKYTQAEVTDILKKTLNFAEVWHSKTGKMPPPQLTEEMQRDHSSALERFLALTTLILWAGSQPTNESDDDIKRFIEEAKKKKNLNQMFKLLDNLFKGMMKCSVDDPLVWQVSCNRSAMPSISKSVQAVKADAATSLFDVKCNGITWAVIDSGIDGGHPAFMINEEESRVKRSFDFKNFRKIVNLGNQRPAIRKKNIDELKKENKFLKHPLESEVKLKEAEEDLDRLAKDAREQGTIQWELVEKYVEIDPKTEPDTNHGTHVAGILGASKKAAENGAGENWDFANGMCPDISFYDFRVLGSKIEDAEFLIIAAIQFIGYLNKQEKFLKIHGANLSLSIAHDVRNFACGRTPVCDACEQLVSSGVVVVAAAGNHGYKSFETKDGSFDSYAAFSITDPGNADKVLTVGATHRFWPHTYGVSFFSSRGPTGDGRMKPDLVAPGERIHAPFRGDHDRGGAWGDLDGTSMAAPHVSGAAAMLMARYPELIGQPDRIKRILCETATDLGRERSFQGHGMLDVLRAFQSI